MIKLSVEECRDSPSDMFTRVGQGEMIEVTKDGNVIATGLPDSSSLGRYTDPTTRGLMKLTATTTSDLDSMPRYAVPEGISPLDVLLSNR